MYAKLSILESFTKYLLSRICVGVLKTKYSTHYDYKTTIVEDGEDNDSTNALSEIRDKMNDVCERIFRFVHSFECGSNHVTGQWIEVGGFSRIFYTFNLQKSDFWLIFFKDFLLSTQAFPHKSAPRLLRQWYLKKKLKLQRIYLRYTM